MDLKEFVKLDEKKISIFIVLAIWVYIASGFLFRQTGLQSFGVIELVFIGPYMLIVLPIFPLLYFFDITELLKMETLAASVIMSFYLYLLSGFLVYLHKNLRKVNKSLTILTGMILLLLIFLLLWQFGIM